MKKNIIISLSLRCSLSEAFVFRTQSMTSKPAAFCPEKSPYYVGNVDISRTKNTLRTNGLGQSVKSPDDFYIPRMENTLRETGIIEDSANFSFEDQRVEDWVKFSVATGIVLAITSYAWFLPFGPHMGDSFLSLVQGLIGTTAPDVTIFTLLIFFAIAHSGLAGLRSYGEQFVGARAWRVLFAVVSLPLALSCMSYFVNHAHEGTQLWDLRSLPGHEYIHATCFVTDFVSFLLLYPSTFNLLEIAAIKKPELHFFDTGVMRITRHPQAVGQILWCVAHSAWIGSSTTVSASSILIAHHLFSMWHGDRRLEKNNAQAYQYLKEKTSIIPFQAVLEGRQTLPDDYYKEFLRGPYALVVVGTLAAYYAHPWMMAGAALLKW